MTDITLREYVDSQIAALRTEIGCITTTFAMRFASQDEATKKAESSLSKRLDGMNEFRDTLRDQAGRLATKEEIQMRAESIDRRIAALENARSVGEGQARVTTVLWSAFTAIVVAVLVAVVVGALK